MPISRMRLAGTLLLFLVNVFCEQRNLTLTGIMGRAEFERAKNGKEKYQIWRVL